MSRRTIRDLVLAIAGVLYLALVLARNVYSPVWALALIAFAGFELFDSHRNRHKSARFPERRDRAPRENTKE